MKKQKQNLVVGAEVLIDYPIRWKTVDEQHRQRCYDEAKAKEFYFGWRGIVVAYNPGCEDGKEFKIKLHDGPHAGQLVNLWQGALTIEAMPKEDETDALLLAILNKLEEIKINTRKNEQASTYGDPH